MTDLRQAAQQALDALELSAVTVDGFGVQKATQAAITALRTALEQPGQEPTPWRDMVVVTLAREGINKHKARELADHFATQPVQEPVGEVVEVNNDGFRCEFNHRLAVGTKLYTAPPLPVQEPVGYVKGTYAGRLIYDTINPAVCLPVGMALYTAPLPVQEPTGMLHINRLDKWLDASLKERKQHQWVGLTEEEIAVIGDKVANEHLVGLVSNFRVRLARAIEQTLKEKNHG